MVYNTSLCHISAQSKAGKVSGEAFQGATFAPKQPVLEVAPQG